jgi:hypothetical protein
VQSYRDPFFNEPVYQQAYGLHQVMDNHTSLIIKDRKELGVVTQQIKANALSHNTVYEASMINNIITFFESSEHSDPEILTLMTHDLGFKYSDAPMRKHSENIPFERIKILAATPQMDYIL